MPDGIAIARHATYHHSTSVAFAPGSAVIASACWDGSVALWDAATGALLAFQRDAHASLGWIDLAFATDGRLLVTAGSDGKLRTWSVPDLTPVRSWKGADGPIHDVEVSADGQRIAWVSGFGDLTVWDEVQQRGLGTHKVGQPAKGPGPDFRIAFLPRAPEILVASRVGHTLAWLRWDTGATLGKVTAGGPEENPWCNSVCVDRTGLVLVNDGRVAAWDLSQQARRWTGGRCDPDAFALNPACPRLAHSPDDGVVAIVDTATGREVFRTRLGTIRISALAFSPDGRSLVVGDRDGTLRVLSAAPARERGAARRVQAEAQPLALQMINEHALVVDAILDRE